MPSPDLLLVEPSKKGVTHIGFLKQVMDASAGLPSVRFYCHAETRALLEAEAPRNMVFSDISVVNGFSFFGKFYKTVLELFWVLRVARSAAPTPVVVTCLLSTSLFLLEYLASALRVPNLHVILHGELEGVTVDDPPITGFAYWTQAWFARRDPESRLKPLVIADFIREGLMKLAPDAGFENIKVFPYGPEKVRPQRGLPALSAPRQGKRIAFIGHKTAHKGYDRFLALAAIDCDNSYFAIGDGEVLEVHSQSSSSLADRNAYAAAIEACDVALFLYSRAYDFSVSAALLDALEGGLSVIAVRSRCFEYFATLPSNGEFLLLEDFDSQAVLGLIAGCAVVRDAKSPVIGEKALATRRTQCIDAIAADRSAPGINQRT